METISVGIKDKKDKKKNNNKSYEKTTDISKMTSELRTTIKRKTTSGLKNKKIGPNRHGIASNNKGVTEKRLVHQKMRV